METPVFIDVPSLEPKAKHPTIFQKFDDLQVGEAVLIHNDHDPKPLYYQMLAERGEIFNWEYLKNGPDVWEVKITKNSTEEPTVGQLVAEDYRKAEVFKKFGIDFCCGGNKSIKDASEEKGVASRDVEEALGKLDEKQQSSEMEFKNWDLDLLSDYIVKQHHTYVKENIPLLYEFIYKIADVHGENHPELKEVASNFTAVANELKNHMEKEEQVLFPYIKDMVKSRDEKQPFENPSFGSIQNPINMMEKEHQDAGDSFENIRQLTNNYTLPQDACNTYQVAFKKLEEFESDLHKHIHLENNILFPKAIEMEKTMIN